MIFHTLHDENGSCAVLDVENVRFFLSTGLVSIMNGSIHAILAGSQPLRQTLAPSLAKRIAVAFPIPEFPPVIKATLSISFILLSIHFFMCSRRIFCFIIMWMK